MLDFVGMLCSALTYILPRTVDVCNAILLSQKIYNLSYVLTYVLIVHAFIGSTDLGRSLLISLVISTSVASTFNLHPFTLIDMSDCIGIISSRHLRRETESVWTGHRLHANSTHCAIFWINWTVSYKVAKAAKCVFIVKTFIHLGISNVWILKDCNASPRQL